MLLLADPTVPTSSKIRIRDGRAKPIDLLAKYISAEDDDLAVEMHEPYTFLNGLTVADMEDLLEDIQVHGPCALLPQDTLAPAPQVPVGPYPGTTSKPAACRMLPWALGAQPCPPVAAAEAEGCHGHGGWRVPGMTRPLGFPPPGVHGAGAGQERGLLAGHDHHHRG